MYGISNGDLLIFAWLALTWFYEGNHKRCAVAMICSKCGGQETHTCIGAQPVDRDKNET